MQSFSPEGVTESSLAIHCRVMAKRKPNLSPIGTTEPKEILLFRFVDWKNTRQLKVLLTELSGGKIDDFQQTMIPAEKLIKSKA